MPSPHASQVLSRVLAVLRLAIETDRPAVVEVALDCIQKLIAFQFLQGAAYVIDLDKQTGMTEATGEREKGQGGASPLTV